jgi:hypothetical protein
MPCRLYRRDAVRKGDWFFAVECRKCKLPIYILDEPTRGTNPVMMVGGGELSIPCNRCQSDEMYSFNELTAMEATEDLPSTYPERGAVSSSSRKPLLIDYPDAKTNIGVGYIEDRPRAAALVGRIVTSWADTEVQCARLLAELMGTNIPAAAAVFGSLRSSRAQSDALTAAAEAVLNENDLLLFEAHIKRRAALEKERNDLAHGCFGVSPAIPDHVVWIAQTDFLVHTAAQQGGGNHDFDLRERQFVYEVGTLERIAQEMAAFYDQLTFFIGYLSARSGGTQGQEFRAARYGQLCEQPHIKPYVEALQAKVKVKNGKIQ